MDRPGTEIKNIYSAIGRLTFNTLIHKLNYLMSIYHELNTEQKIVSLKFIQSELNFLLWIIGTPELVDEVRQLERENIHLRYSLYYNAGSI
jgi:hypothetical protein